jgi:signal transduction histidine kinase
MVEAPGDLPRLPAAVELAAYRIATEALTNTARHARARHCWIRLACNGALDLEVADDGTGVHHPSASGVGLHSMRERAAELGGTCTVEFSPGAGTRIRARLPIRQV